MRSQQAAGDNNDADPMVEQVNNQGKSCRNGNTSKEESRYPVIFLLNAYHCILWCLIFFISGRYYF